MPGGRGMGFASGKTTTGICPATGETTPVLSMRCVPGWIIMPLVILARSAQKGAPRVQTSGGARGRRPPEEGTLRGQRGRRGGQRHEELAGAVVGGSTRLGSAGVKCFTRCFSLSGPARLLSQSSLPRGSTWLTDKDCTAGEEEEKLHQWVNPASVRFSFPQRLLAAPTH